MKEICKIGNKNILIKKYENFFFKTRTFNEAFNDTLSLLNRPKELWKYNFSCIKYLIVILLSKKIDFIKVLIGSFLTDCFFKAK